MAAAVWKKQDHTKLQARLKLAISNDFPALAKQGTMKKNPQKPKLISSQNDEKNLSLAEQLQRQSRNLKAAPAADATGQTLEATFADMLKAQLKTLKTIDPKSQNTPQKFKHAPTSTPNTPGAKSRQDLAKQLAFHLKTSGRNTSRSSSMKTKRTHDSDSESDREISDNESSATDSDFD